MKLAILTAVPAACLLSFAAGAALQEMPAPAKPGQQHQVLRGMVGEWKTTTKIMGEESDGKQTFEMDLGGLWLVGRLEGEFMGQPFHGMSINGWDTTKKKHVGIWVDSFTASIQSLEGGYDATKNQLEYEAPSVNPMSGEPMTEIHRWTFADENNMTFHMLYPQDDGGEYEVFSIHYARQ
jgi:hypothetical protein